MMISEKIIHVMDVKSIKRATVANALGMTRAAFRKRLLKNKFHLHEMPIIANALEMSEENLNNVVADRTQGPLLGAQTNHHSIVLSYTMNRTLNGGDDLVIEKIENLLKQIHSLGQKSQE